MEFLVGIFYIFSIIAMIALMCIYPAVVLSPFIKGKPKPGVAPQFLMSDLFSLMFLVQLPFAITNLVDARVQESPITVGGLMLVGAMTWFLGLRAVNHHRVDSRLKRFVGIGLTIPFAIIGGLLMPRAFAMIIALCSNGPTWINSLWIPVHLLLGWMTYRSSKWVLAKATVENVCQPETDSQHALQAD